MSARRTKALLSSAILFSTAPYVSADASSYAQNAEAAANQLQTYYDASSGLWSTTGWWNSGNCLTVMCNLMKLDSSVNSAYSSIIANTFNNAPNNGPGVSVNVVQVRSEESKGVNTSASKDHSKNKLLARGKSRLRELTKRNSGFLDDYYDDEGWWGLAWVSAYDLTGDSTYLAEAETIFNDMTYAWPSNCGNGGIWWDRTHSYVNAIANELFFSLAAALANRDPSGSAQGTSYADWTKNSWTWFSNSGMINSGNTINDGLTDGCTNNGETVWSYNQGVVLGGLVEYYKLSNDASLLTTATNIANAAIAALAPDGILHESCEPNCNSDSSQFKGVFMRNLQLLQETAPQSSWVTFIQNNAQSIWNTDVQIQSDSADALLGQVWSGFVSGADATTQSSAMDALVAALAVS